MRHADRPRLGLAWDQRHAEVSQFRHTALVDHDIRRLEVPMHDSPLINRFEGPRQIGGDLNCSLGGQDADLDEQVAQAEAINVLHYQVLVASGILVHLIDGDDVGVMEREHRTGLTLEALDISRVQRGIGRVPTGEQFLDGDVISEASVEGEVDAAECPLADDALDAVATINDETGHGVVARRNLGPVRIIGKASKWRRSMHRVPSIR